MYEINYNIVKPQPTYAELIHVVDYPNNLPDRNETFTKYSPYLTQFDGIGMVDMKEQQHPAMIERQKEYMLRKITTQPCNS